MQSGLLSLFLSRFHLTPVSITENEMRHFIKDSERQIVRANVVHVAVDDNVFFIFVPASQNFNVVDFSRYTNNRLRVLQVAEIRALREQLAGNAMQDSSKQIRLMVDDVIRGYRSVIVPAGDGKTFNMWNVEELVAIEEQKPLDRVVEPDPGITTLLHPYQNKDWYKILQSLPLLQTTTKELLRLNCRKDWTTDDLVSIIAHDPVVSVRIMNSASSVLFHHAGEISNLYDAVFRVLGTNTAMNIALAISTTRIFKLPQAGILGVDNVSSASMHVAVMMNLLMQRMPQTPRLDSGLAYLIGLLANIGLFVLGQIDHRAYRTLSRNYANHPEKDLARHAEQIFGISHMQLAAMALKKWGMPRAIITVVEQYDNDDYAGEFLDYVYLFRIAERVLLSHGLSYAPESTISSNMLDTLGINEDDIAFALDEVILRSGEISHFAYQMCA